MRMHGNSENYDVIVCTNTILNDEITPLFIIYTLESLLLHILANFRQHSDNTPLSRTVQPGTGPRFGVTERLRCIQIDMERAGCLLISSDFSCFNHRFHCFTASIY